MPAARFSIFILLSVAVSSCAEEGEPEPRAEQVEDSVLQEREKLVKLIEESVVLPEHTLDLDGYSRYHAMRGDGVVVASYTIHPPDFRESVAEACREISEAPFPCPIDGGEVRLVDAGETAWAESPLDLPGAEGGSCGQLNVEYLPSEERFLRVECNGPY